jgi:hypothetical protein
MLLGYGVTKAHHNVFFAGQNQSVSQGELVRAVTANLVERPLSGAALATAMKKASSRPAKDSGQADCPT